jgi:hypothetical protein
MALIPRIRQTLKKRIELHGSRDRAIKIDVHVRMRILPMIVHQLVPHRLQQRVPICPSRLQHVSDAPVKVVLVPFASPERQVPRWKQVIHQLRNRAMNVLHERAKVFTNLKITKCVIVIVQKGRHPGDKTVALTVVIEPVPEDQLCLLGFKRGILVAAPRCDEVDAVVAVPVLEPVNAFIELVPGIRAFAEVRHGAGW